MVRIGAFGHTFHGAVVILNILVINEKSSLIELITLPDRAIPCVIQRVHRTPGHGSDRNMPRRPTTNPTAQRDALLLQIAERHLFLETLDTRNTDSLDFHEHAVWAVRSALEAAFEAGRRAAAETPTTQP